LPKTCHCEDSMARWATLRDENKCARRSKRSGWLGVENPFARMTRDAGRHLELLP
jgi:hypothetical protein